MRLIATMAAALAVSGCASSSGVYAVEGGSYRVSSSAITSFGGAGTAKSKALKLATAQCSKIGKRPVVTSDATDANITGASVDVTFRCE